MICLFRFGKGWKWSIKRWGVVIVSSLEARESYAQACQEALVAFEKLPEID